MTGVYAYVIKPDDTVEMRTVEVGQEYRGQSVVTKGLAANERVVIDGQMRLQQGTKVDTGGQERPDQTGPVQTGSIDQSAPMPSRTQ
jgi:multidrug efflux pump subunit AcrA (membrane-fusion protein)